VAIQSLVPFNHLSMQVSQLLARMIHFMKQRAQVPALETK